MSPKLFDATGSSEGQACPRCGSEATITYHFDEGFEELECTACGYISDAEELAALQRFDGALQEADPGAEHPSALFAKKIEA